jgi:hypothetical protein
MNLFLITVIMLIAGCVPVISRQEPDITITVNPDADAYVGQSDPDTNMGSKEILEVDSKSDKDESFVRFTVPEFNGIVQKVILRLYTPTNGSTNGPAVYVTHPTWVESGITWNNRPATRGNALDNKRKIQDGTWTEYDVSQAVTGMGAFSFALAADSGDAVFFASRESEWPPELVISYTPETTAPTPTNSASDVTFVGAGDISMCSNDYDKQTAELLDNIPGTVFTTGDNAYSDGTQEQYMNCYGPTWGSQKERTKPVPGNHEYHTQEAGPYFQYFDHIPSYYAYNLGSWRIYALNSEIDVTDNGDQIKWVQQDLAAHPNKCVLAYWHTPRWSSGVRHGSNPNMQILWKTFYDAGAELVLNGHEHNYERFMPMNADGLADPHGLREFVVGTGGGTPYPFGSPLPTSEVRETPVYGVLKLTLRSDSYDWQFIPTADSTFTDSGSTQCH